MSKTTNNSLTKSYGGKFGKDFVLRTRDDVSIMAKPPKKSLKEPAESQMAIRYKFKTATRWAKQALQDPDLLAFYQSKANGMKTPYAIAVGDYMTSPIVKEIDASGYNGIIGDRIRIAAIDKVKVKSVTVTLTGNDGSMIESAPCVESLEANAWYFTATVAVPDLTGVKITAVAHDIPQHTGELEMTL
ncbi:MAG: hypothetical protein M0Q38_06380 [Bacteroidales bacterium]|jgi:hypothetical protein|nr:hypothetical protein [Bacteroidales bacterium]